MSEERSIESCLAQLEKINDQLQDKTMRMDEAIELYRRGSELSKEVERMLHTYEQQIEVIETSTEEAQP